jgi:hypothetical protein
VNQVEASGVDVFALHHKRLVCTATWKRLGTRRGEKLDFGGSKDGQPSNRKGELPMEITATLTALTALVSFGFVAAVILGMI